MKNNLQEIENFDQVDIIYDVPNAHIDNEQFERIEGSPLKIVPGDDDHKNIIKEGLNESHKGMLLNLAPPIKAANKEKALYDMYTYMSALQKSVRWCEVNASRYFAKKLIEMGKPGAAINRLLVIASEDVGLADPTLLKYVRECSDEFEARIKKYKVKKSQVTDFPNVCRFIDQAATAAALSYKSRLLDMITFVTLFDIYKNEGFSHNLLDYLKRFQDAVQVQDEKMALYYAFIVVVALGAEVQFFAAVNKESASRNTALIREWVIEYRRSKELMVLAGIVALVCRDLNFQHGEYHASVANQMSLPVERADIPDRAFDKHTVMGRRKERGFRHFFKEAASVKNERFPNAWQGIGEEAFYQADKQGLAKAPDLVKAIKKKASSGKSGHGVEMLVFN